MMGIMDDNINWPIVYALNILLFLVFAAGLVVLIAWLVRDARRRREKAGLLATTGRRCAEGTEHKEAVNTSRDPYPVAAGVLSICLGVVNLAFAIFILFWQFPMPGVNRVHLTLGGTGIACIIGGILAVRRRYWPLALIGAAASIFSGSLFTALPGIVPVVLIAASRNQFDKPHFQETQTELT